MATLTDRTRAFRTLHDSGCFVIPNPWDRGSARVLAGLGFPALATTSSGFAWSMGTSDNHVPLDDMLAHLRAIAGAVSVPVNADFEGGFAIEPEAVAANVARAAETGIAGLSIEDSTGDPARPLFDFQLAVERVRAARRAIGAALASCSPAAPRGSSPAAPISLRRSAGSRRMPRPAPSASTPRGSGRRRRSPQW